MKAAHWLGLFLLGAALAVAGCGTSDTAKNTANKEAGGPDNKVDEAKVKENLARLSPEDRNLAEAQRFCAVQSDNRLGEMGAPFKIEIQGEPVFLCCKQCQKEARDHPEETLARVKELRAKAAAK